MSSEQTFKDIGQKIKGEPSQMFGKPCFKIKGKAFMCFFQDELVFKLTDGAHAEASKLEGAHPFDPSGKRPMKEWIQVPAKHSGVWEKLAKAAMAYVKETAS